MKFFLGDSDHRLLGRVLVCLVLCCYCIALSVQGFLFSQKSRPQIELMKPSRCPEI